MRKYQLETDNSILFPASKNYSLEDPVLELLEEYSYLEHDELDQYLFRPMDKEDFDYYNKRALENAAKLNEAKDKIQNIQEILDKDKVVLQRLRYLQDEIDLALI